jgi:hypothetical protein
MKYPCILTQRDVLTILKVGLYRVCPLTGAVTNQRGRVIAPFYDDNGRAFIRLYWEKHRKAITVARLVWMSVTLRIIPGGYEIHHRDEDVTNNAWTNLYCLFEMDHQKLHGADLLAGSGKMNEVPF